MTTASASASRAHAGRSAARARRDGIRTSLHVECRTFYRQSLPPRLPCPVSTLAVRRSRAPPSAAWLSQGTLAFTGVGDARIALLPLSIGAGLIVAARGRGGVGARGAPARRSRRCGCSALLVLPWLPRVAAGGVPACGPARWR